MSNQSKDETAPGRVRDGLREVLVISYYYPPSGGPGVQRVLKFTRYLPTFGYRPLILTVPENAAFPMLDPTLMGEIPPEALIFRAPLREFYSLYRRAAGRKDREEPVNLSTSARPPAGLRERILRSLRAGLFIPDGRMGWYPQGVRWGGRICRQRRVELIFASGPPFTAHWIGRSLARATGLPLVLDFRDPWTRAPFYPSRPSWARRLDERLERSCLRQAGLVLTVNRHMREDFLRRYTELPPERLEVLTNGFDPEDFRGLSRRPPSRWTLTHTGTLPAGRFPGGLLPALRRILQRHPEWKADTDLRLIGRIAPQSARLFEQPPLSEVARLQGYLPHGQAVQAQLDSHLLLLLIEDVPGARGMLTGKLFEYLGSGTPILALTPEGEAAEIIRSTGAGQAVSGEDQAAIEAALLRSREAYNRGETPYRARDDREIARFSRRELTARLARLFDGFPLSGAPPTT